MIEADTEAYAKFKRRFDENPIQLAREQTGMSIKELAEYLGAPYRTVQDWCNGNRRPPHWLAVILYDHIMASK